MKRARTVTVFIDKKSRQTLKSKNITIQEILDTANSKFQKQSIDIRYKLISTRTWPGFSRWKSFLLGMPSIIAGHYFHLLLWQVAAIKREMGATLSKEFIKRKPHNILFITDQISVGYGVALFKPEWDPSIPSQSDGTGVIVLGVCPSWDFANNRQELLEMYVNIMMHEHGHLYGLGHTNRRHSLMNGTSDCIGEKLDRYSKKQLQNVLKRLK